MLSGVEILKGFHSHCRGNPWSVFHGAGIASNTAVVRPLLPPGCQPHIDQPRIAKEGIHLAFEPRLPGTPPDPVTGEHQHRQGNAGQIDEPLAHGAERSAAVQVLDQALKSENP